MTLKLVLFDLDDTLCDYAGARSARLRIAFSTAISALPDSFAMDLDVLIEESIQIHPHGADHFESLLARHGVADRAAALVARTWYQTHRFHGLELFPDALAILAASRGGEANRGVGLITNGPADIQRDKIALLGLEPHVDFALISGEFGVAKPDSRIFHEALRIASAEPRETVYVGDSPEFDVVGAQLAGMTAIWVNRSGHPWSHPERRPDHEIDRLSQLPHLIESLVE